MSKDDFSVISRELCGGDDSRLFRTFCRFTADKKEKIRNKRWKVNMFIVWLFFKSNKNVCEEKNEKKKRLAKMRKFHPLWSCGHLSAETVKTFYLDRDGRFLINVITMKFLINVITMTFKLNDSWRNLETSLNIFHANFSIRLVRNFCGMANFWTVANCFLRIFQPKHLKKWDYKVSLILKKKENYA